MKFSVVIPTSDRPDLLGLAAKYVMEQGYQDFELIVSDNSTTPELRSKTKDTLETWRTDSRLQYVNPPEVLSPPEHFEFALERTTGDYVLFLTDKMMIAPGTLGRVGRVLDATDAEIVNWPYATYVLTDWSRPWSSGVLVDPPRDFSRLYSEFEPSAVLRAKASGLVSRDQQSERDYVTGKICFGCYRRDLIDRIKARSGGLFGGCTHDYSAMVQALCLADRAALLTPPGVVIVSLPPDKSLGSLTQQRSSAALKYYRSFSSPRDRLSSLYIPELYSSQHNMVASDYVKYLTLDGSLSLFGAEHWLRWIGLDLKTAVKTWSSEQERKEQEGLFFAFLRQRPASYLHWHLGSCRDAITKLRAGILNLLKPVRGAVRFLEGMQRYGKSIVRSDGASATCRAPAPSEYPDLDTVMRQLEEGLDQGAPDALRRGGDEHAKLY